MGLGTTKMTMDIPRLSWEAIRTDLNDLTLKFMMMTRNLHVPPWSMITEVLTIHL
jgi:hypothetical protein